MFWEGIAQHQRLAVHIEMHVHGPALVIGRNGRRNLGAERTLVEFARFDRPIHHQVRRQAPPYLRFGRLRGIGSALGGSIREFKNAVRDDEPDSTEAKIEKAEKAEKV